MTRQPVPRPASGPGPDFYRAATAPLFAAGGVAVAALVADPRALLTADSWLVVAGFVGIAAISSFAAGSLVRRFAGASAAASALASGVAVWTLASRLAEARAAERFGEPLSEWIAPVAAIATVAAAFPAAAAGSALRRRLGR